MPPTSRHSSSMSRYTRNVWHIWSPTPCLGTRLIRDVDIIHRRYRHHQGPVQVRRHSRGLSRTPQLLRRTGTILRRRKTGLISTGLITGHRCLNAGNSRPDGRDRARHRHTRHEPRRDNHTHRLTPVGITANHIIISLNNVNRTQTQRTLLIITDTFTGHQGSRGLDRMEPRDYRRSCRWSI